jgi:hypothetical protein
MDTQAFTTGLDHAAIMAAAARVEWTVDGVFRERVFDASRPLVPATWVGTGALSFLDAHQQLVLNHCRAFSYVHLLGNYEDFIVVHLDGMVAHRPHEAVQARAMAHFGADERKHQQLFLRAEAVLERSCGHAFGRYFDAEGRHVAALTAAILRFPLLSRFLVLLALEWGTQRHYVESVRDAAGERSDPLYVDVLRAHWAEEAQHTKWDTLAIADLARESDAEDLRGAFDDVPRIGGVIDATFAGQARAEIDTLERVTARRLPDPERATLQRALHDSLAAIVTGVALSHPRFAKVARELSAEGAASIGIV